MRNGDIAPSRLDAQSEAATMLFNMKRTANVENSISLMTMAGDGPKVLVTLTSDPNKISAAINTVRPSGSARFTVALEIAQVCMCGGESSLSFLRA